MRNLLDRDDVRAFAHGAVGLDHLRQAAGIVLHQHVGQQQRERLVADQFARAPHRVAEAERRLLAGEARGAGTGKVVRQELEVGELAALLQGQLELELAIEMVLDDALVAAGDEDEMLDAGLARLVDHVLDQRPVDDRQHLLGHRLGGGQEPGAEAGDREDGFADRFHGASIGRETFIAPAEPRPLFAQVRTNHDRGRRLRFPRSMIEDL